MVTGVFCVHIGEQTLEDSQAWCIYKRGEVGWERENNFF